MPNVGEQKTERVQPDYEHMHMVQSNRADKLEKALHAALETIRTLTDVIYNTRKL